LALWACPSAAEALTINTIFVPAGNEISGVGMAEGPAGGSTGRGDLSSIVRAAADAWEAVILDNHTVTVNFGWFPTEPISPSAYHQALNAGGNPQRPTEGSVVFNSRRDGDSPFFYLDPTPDLNEEFVFSEHRFDDFGGGPVESRSDFTPVSDLVIGGHDIYTTALHEIGHAIGLSAWNFYTSETADGDIDVAIRGFAGTAIPTSASHLDVSGPLMSSRGRPRGHRRDITQLDVLAVCQVAQYERCRVNFEPDGLSGDYNADGAVNAADYVIWRNNALSGAVLNGDATPGLVTQGDYFVWQDNFGVSLSGAASAARLDAAVPEPATGLLFALAALSMAIWRHRS
jgi:hypothetical protein